jgi:hypothetical protein
VLSSSAALLHSHFEHPAGVEATKAFFILSDYKLCNELNGTRTILLREGFLLLGLIRESGKRSSSLRSSYAWFSGGSMWAS